MIPVGIFHSEILPVTFVVTMQFRMSGLRRDSSHYNNGHTGAIPQHAEQSPRRIRNLYTLTLFEVTLTNAAIKKTCIDRR